MLHIDIVPAFTMWEVRVKGRQVTRWPTKWDALRFARLVAEREGAAEIVIFDDDGPVSCERYGD